MIVGQAQPRTRDGRYGIKPVADAPDAAGLELGGEQAAAGGSGEFVLMMADAEPPTGLEPLPELVWTPMRGSDGDAYGMWVWPYPDRSYPVPGAGDRYWARVRVRKAPLCSEPVDTRMWFWDVLFGEVAADGDDLLDDVWDELDDGREWHEIEGVWLRGTEVGAGRAGTLHEAQTQCQSAADEHHHGPEIAWWAYAQRAAAGP